MVKIGEVEFLVKFDNVGKQFKNLIKDAIDDADFDMSSMDEELKRIRRHLGLLRVGFSGDYASDLYKKDAWVKRMSDTKYQKNVAARIAADETQMGYFDKDVELNSPKARSIALGVVEDTMVRMADLVDRAFASETSYKNLGPKLNKVMKRFEVATETEVGHVLYNIIGYLSKESEIDRTIVKDELIKNKDTAITDTKAHFATIAKKVDEGTGEIVVDTADKFKQAITDYITTPGNIEELYLASSVVLQGSLREEINDMIAKIKFMPGDFLVPNALISTIEDITGLTKLKGRVKSPDVRAVYRDIDDVMDTIDKFHTENTPEDVEKLKKEMEKTMDDLGWIFLLWENKLTGSEMTKQRDLQPWKGSGYAVMGSQIAGTGGLQTKPEMLEYEKNMDQIVENLAKEDPARKESALSGMLQQILQILTLTFKNVKNIPDELKKVKEALEVYESKTLNG